MSGLTIENSNKPPSSSPPTTDSQHVTEKKTRKVTKKLLFHFGSSIVTHFKIDPHHECSYLQTESDTDLFAWNGLTINEEELINKLRQENLASVLEHCALNVNISSLSLFHLLVLFNRIACKHIKYSTWEQEWKGNFTKIVWRSLDLIKDFKPVELKTLVLCCSFIEYKDSHAWQAIITEYSKRADGRETRVGYRIADFSPHDLACSVLALYLAHCTDTQMVFSKMLQEILRRASWANLEASKYKTGKEPRKGLSWSDFSDEDLTIIKNTLHNIKNNDLSLLSALHPFHEDLLQLLKVI